MSTRVRADPGKGAPVSRSAVLFDIDGTLLDSNYLHALAWRRAFLDCGREIPTARIHHRIGMGSERLLRELLGDQAAEIAAAATAAHQRHFDLLKPELRPFPGARELLAAVRRRGPLVVLASSAGAHELPALIRTLGGMENIDLATSADDVENAKPEPDLFEVAMSRAGVQAANAVAVGDTVWDIEAARRAGIGCVAVLTGGTCAGELRAAGALAVHSDVAELLMEIDTGPLCPLWT
jgi:HAD superfamily hydrolase (TIGR01509 family)